MSTFSLGSRLSHPFCCSRLYALARRCSRSTAPPQNRTIRTSWKVSPRLPLLACRIRKHVGMQRALADVCDGGWQAGCGSVKTVGSGNDERRASARREGELGLSEAVCPQVHQRLPVPHRWRKGIGEKGSGVICRNGPSGPLFFSSIVKYSSADGGIRRC